MQKKHFKHTVCKMYTSLFKILFLGLGQVMVSGVGPQHPHQPSTIFSSGMQAVNQPFSTGVGLSHGQQVLVPVGPPGHQQMVVVSAPQTLTGNVTLSPQQPQQQTVIAQTANGGLGNQTIVDANGRIHSSNGAIIGMSQPQQAVRTAGGMLHASIQQQQQQQQQYQQQMISSSQSPGSFIVTIFMA